MIDYDLHTFLKEIAGELKGNKFKDKTLKESVVKILKLWKHDVESVEKLIDMKLILKIKGNKFGINWTDETQVSELPTIVFYSDTFQYETSQKFYILGG